MLPHFSGKNNSRGSFNLSQAGVLQTVTPPDKFSMEIDFFFIFARCADFMVLIFFCKNFSGFDSIRPDRSSRILAAEHDPF